MNDFVDLQECADKARLLDPTTASEQARFVARVYLRVERNRVVEAFNPAFCDANKGRDKLARIDADIRRLT